jgi:hypothetical protein
VDVPIVAGVTQSLAPLARPYLASKQLAGMIAGVPAAAAYESYYFGASSIPVEQVAGFRIAQWVVIAIVIVGGVYYGIAAIRASRAKQAER